MWLLLSDLDRSIPELMESALLVAHRLARGGGHSSEISRILMFDDFPEESSANVEVQVSDPAAFRRLTTFLRRRSARFEIRDERPVDVPSCEDRHEVSEKIHGLVEGETVIRIHHDAARDCVVVHFC
jgi:hypothetical protein